MEDPNLERNMGAGAAHDEGSFGAMTASDDGLLCDGGHGQQDLKSRLRQSVNAVPMAMEDDQERNEGETVKEEEEVKN